MTTDKQIILEKILFRELADKWASLFLMSFFTAIIWGLSLLYQGLPIMFIQSVAVTVLFAGIFTITFYYIDYKKLKKEIK